MGKHNFLLRFDKRNFESIRWSIQLCSLKFVATDLGVLIVPEVRQGAKDHRAFTEQRADELLWQVLVQARHEGAQRLG